MKILFKFVLLLTTVWVYGQNSPGVYTVKNAKINTTNSDFGTAFYGDDKVVFAAPKQGFTFNREEYNSQPFLDLYIAEVTEDGQIIKKQKMPGDINSKYHEGMVSFTKDKKTVYFSANNYVKKKKNKDKIKGTTFIQLLKATISEDGEWTNLELLPFNGKDFSTGHPVLNRDDTKLYFVSDRPDSYGKTDIFVVDIHEDGSFGEPKNLGPEINTPEREMFPFIGKDNVLYFSSDGYPGHGELDVYASKIFDTTVSEPINLEEPVNSEFDDFAYIIDDHKHRGYFSSNREGGHGDDDIYSFLADPPIYIECQQEITGVVKDIQTQQLVPDVLVVLYDAQGKELESFISSKTTGTFNFQQACNANYTIRGYLEGYLIAELDIRTVNDLNAPPIEVVLNLVSEAAENIQTIAVTDAQNAIDQVAQEEIADVAQEEISDVAQEEIADVAQEEIAEVSQVEITDQVEITEEAATASVNNPVAESAEMSVAQIDQEKENELSESMISENQQEKKLTGVVIDGETGELLPNVQVVLYDDKGEEVSSFMSDAEDASFKFTAAKENSYTIKGFVDGELKGTLVLAEQQGIGIGDENLTLTLMTASVVVDAEATVIEESAADELVEASEIDSDETDEIDRDQTEEIEAVAFTEIEEADLEEEIQEALEIGEVSEIAMTAPNEVQAEEERAPHEVQRPLEVANVIHINTIYFDFDKHNIRYDARIELDKIAVVLKENPQSKIRVDSHTDIRGKKSYNMNLSNNRAKSTIQYLLDKGIDEERITGEGHGENDLAVKCTKANPCNSLQHQLNRRSEFLIVDQLSEMVIAKSRNETYEEAYAAFGKTKHSGAYANYDFSDHKRIYSVQVGAFKGKFQHNKSSQLTALFNYRYEDGLNRYFAGVFETPSEARSYRNELRKNGFKDAFVVGLQGKQRF